ncbi:MAG: GH1 family beta-glucosidase [Cytophagales bacterium]|nr:GH1 family beta-glucosidase [Cytophagales bacterium]MDW8384955.1 GH1 family beta-glucosidase [Flammeovirgaceae bacterium]
MALLQYVRKLFYVIQSISHFMYLASSLKKSSFGQEFVWGTATAAAQIEGAFLADGKGLSIWDTFSALRGKIKQNHHNQVACNFYYNYPNDVRLMKEMNIKHHRFSIAWTRVLPEGVGKPNQKGLDFYDRLIDFHLECGITPWITLYHWDLPQILENQGGWTNREILNWFAEYVNLCTRKYGDRVKNWMVLNEPMVFTGAGYFLGVHAPGRKWLNNFLPACHHAALAMGVGGRIVRQNVKNAHLGTTFSCSWIEPYRPEKELDKQAAFRVDALLNRLFLEPVLGLGYPIQDIPLLKKIEKYFLPEDEKLLPFEFDFIGVQNYTREIVKYSFLTPYINAEIIPGNKRNVLHTLMNWEVYPESIYHILKKYHAYPQIKKLIVTENGAAFEDHLHHNEVYDTKRLQFLQEYIYQVFRAKQEGVNVQGYFVWTFMDNFEWAEGYSPRFGIVYVDFDTQKRIVKESGRWYANFLSE